MVLYKNFQINNLNSYQAKTSFKNFLLTSVNNFKLKYNHSVFYSTRTSTTKYFSIKESILDSFKLRLLNLNLRKLFNNGNLKSINIKKKFLKSSTCLATIARPNQTKIEKSKSTTFIDGQYLIDKFSNLSTIIKKYKSNSKLKYNQLNYAKRFYFKYGNFKKKDYENIYKNYLNYFNEKRDQLLKNINQFYKRFKINLEFLKLNKKHYLSLSATGGLFSWDKYRITNEDIKNDVDEILTLFNINKEENSSENKLDKIMIDFESARLLENSEWKLIYDKKDLIIWRRNFILNDEDEDETLTKTEKVNYDLFEYKVLGRLKDITPIEFYQTQLDLEYRKEWDYLVISLDIIDKDQISNTELIRWTMRFPYPLNPREYIYVRRYCIDPAENLLVLVSKSIPNCKIELKKHENEHKSEHQHNQKGVINKHHNTFHNQSAHQNVRVTKYKSNMIIIPHGDFDKPGLDYVIQYYDVNKAKIPKLAYKWMATSGLPDYIDKLHKATLKLKHRNKLSHRNEENDILSKFETLYLNKQFNENESDQTVNDNEENEHEKSEDRSEKYEIENKINKSVGETSNVKIEINNENLSKLEEDKSFDKIKFYSLVVLEKVYKDFFSDYEPHSIFYN